MKSRFLFSILILIIISSCSQQTGDKSQNSTTVQQENPTPGNTVPVLFENIHQYITKVESEIASIPEERKDILKKIALYINSKKGAGEEVNLVFICTHNSRRSHLSQIWANTAAHYYGVAEGIADGRPL